MRASTLLLLALSLAAPPAAADDDDAEANPFSLTVSAPEPAPGSRVYYRLAYENSRSDPIRVPAGLLEAAVFSPGWCPPSGCYGQARGGMGFGFAGRTPAARIDWVTLQPGQALERHGTLAEHFPTECRRGCVPGRYELDVQVPTPAIDGATGDQVVPEGVRESVELNVRVPLVRVTSPQAVQATARVRWVGDDGVRIELKITNRLPFPLYFPPRNALLTSCELRHVGPDGAEEALGSGELSSGGPPFDEKEALLLRPGASRTVTLRSTVSRQPGAKAFASVAIDSNRRFEPTGTRLAASHYFDAALQAPEVEVR